MPPPEGAEGAFEETIEEVVKGTDPAIYLLLVALALAILFFIYKRRSREDDDDYFSNLDGEKVSGSPVFRSYVLMIEETILKLFSCFSSQFNLKLPAEVDEYYAVKQKCLAAGWVPGKVRNELAAKRKRHTISKLTFDNHHSLLTRPTPTALTECWPRR